MLMFTTAAAFSSTRRVKSGRSLAMAPAGMPRAAAISARTARGSANALLIAFPKLILLLPVKAAVSMGSP